MSQCTYTGMHTVTEKRVKYIFSPTVYKKRRKKISLWSLCCQLYLLSESVRWKEARGHCFLRGGEWSRRVSGYCALTTKRRVAALPPHINIVAICSSAIKLLLQYFTAFTLCALYEGMEGEQKLHKKKKSKHLMWQLSGDQYYTEGGGG